jgi:hypothetical protein
VSRDGKVTIGRVLAEHRATLAPIHLANDAGASSAAYSGEMQGKAPPHHSTPLPPLRGGRMAFCSRFAEKEEQEAGTE